METAATYRDYGFPTAAPSHMVQRFIGPVMQFAEPLAPGTRVLDVGCGNGAVCGEFIRRGCEVVGVDLSEQGIAIARATYPQGRFEVIAADATILEQLNETPFDIVVSTEVVEHLYAPREWARGCFAALPPRRQIHLHDAISWLLEEFANFDHRHVGQACESSVGWRPHQALEQAYAWSSALRGGFSRHQVQRCRPRSGPLATMVAAAQRP